MQAKIPAEHLSERVIVRLECANRAGLTVHAAVGPVRFDRTPPAASAVALVAPALRTHDGLLWSNGSVAEIVVDVHRSVPSDPARGSRSVTDAVAPSTAADE